MLFAKRHCHLTMIVMFTTVVLDALWSWLSDTVFKSLGKSTNFHPFHLIERLCFSKTKLASKHELCQKKMHANDIKTHTKYHLKSGLSTLSAFEALSPSFG